MWIKCSLPVGAVLYLLCVFGPNRVHVCLAASLCVCLQWVLAPRFAPGLVGVGSGVTQLGPGAPVISGEADRSLATAFERVGLGTSGSDVTPHNNNSDNLCDVHVYDSDNV